MAFGSLLKPKGSIKMQATENSMPGQQISLDINVVTEEDLNPRQIRAELVGEETYYKTETVSHGRHRNTRTVKKDEPFASVVQVLA